MGYDTYFHGMLEFTWHHTEAEIQQFENLAQEMKQQMGRCDLYVSDDRRGLVYCSEKTRDMVEQINYVISAMKKRIPDFSLKGGFAADTDYEPHLWFIKISSDGTAYAEKATREEFLAVRRVIYPKGYRGFGLIDPTP